MNNSITSKKLREFSYLIGIGFPLIIGYLIPIISGHSFRSWTLLIGLPLLLIGLIKPNLVYYPYKYWMKLGLILGWINSRIILGIVFIFVLQPISIFMFMFKYDPLKKINKKKSSYRSIRTLPKIDLTRIF